MQIQTYTYGIHTNMAMIQTNTCRYCRGTKALAARQLPQSVGSAGGGGVGVIVTGRPGAGPGVTGVTVITES